MIREEHYSPDAIIMSFEKTQWPTSTRIYTRTLYRYISEGLIPDVAPEDLLRKGKRRAGKKCLQKHPRPISAERSITKRQDEADLRQVIGHWEMDCVVSGKNKGTAALLTLTERSKRFQLIHKIKDKTTDSVVPELNKMERSYVLENFGNFL